MLLGAALGVPTPRLEPAPIDPPATVALSWEAPMGCPDQGALERRITGLSPASGSPVEVVGRAIVTESAEGFTAQLELRTPWATSTRALEAERCEALADAIALLVAIAIDPIAVDRTLDAGPLQDAVPEDPPPPPIPAPPSDSVQPPRPAPRGLEPPSPSPPPRSDPRSDPRADDEAMQLVVRPSVGASLGLLPQLGASLHVAAGLRWRWLRAGVQAGHWLPQPAEVDGRPEPVAELRLWGAGVHGCAGPRWGRVELAGCVALHGGRMRGEGRGSLDRIRVEHRPWVAVGFGPALGISLAAPLGLWLAVDGTASLWRPRFHVQGLGSVHEVSPLAITARIGLEVRLGGLGARRRAAAAPRGSSSTDRGHRREG